MRAAVMFAILLAGCGGLLPFVDDGDDPTPAPAPAPAEAGADAADDGTDVRVADGGGTPDDANATADAGSDGGAVWRCTDAGGESYTSAISCDNAFSQACSDAVVVPEGEPCDPALGNQRASCTSCTKVGSGEYAYSKLLCACQ